MGAIKTNLYDFQCYFGLLIDGVLTEILEPDGWDTIRLHSPRSRENFGFTTDFIEDKLGMLFTYAQGSTYPGQKNITGGAEILYNRYETIGPEALIIFQFGEKINNTFNPLYQGKVNLNVYFRQFPGGVSTSVEKMPFQATFLARKSAPVTINNFQNFDLEKLTPISTLQVRLHGQALLEGTQAQTPTPEVSDSVFDGGGNLASFQFAVQPDMSDQFQSELSTVPNGPLGLVNQTSTDIYGDQLYQYQAQFGGTAIIKFSGSCRFWFYLGLDWTCNVYAELKQYRLVEGVYTLISTSTGSVTTIVPTSAPGVWGPNIIGGSAYPAYPAGPGAPSYVLQGLPITRGQIFGYGDTPYSWSLETDNIVVQPLDQFYVHLKMDFSWTSVTRELYYCQLDQYQNAVSISQITVAPSTFCNGYRIFDVLTQMLECCTGEKNALISSFFGPGGPGYKYVLANGFSIRGFGGQAYSFRKDLESLISDLQAIFCTGYGVSNRQNREYLIIEKVTAFFNNNIILKLPNTFNWSDGNSEEWIYNEAKLGYQKYAKDELQMLDAFCTDASYLFQSVRTHTNTLDRKTSLIADGNTLEFARRQQFLQSRTNDNNFDDDIFIIPITDGIYTGISLQFIGSATITPSGGNLQIVFPFLMSLLPGDRVAVLSGPYGGSTFTVYKENAVYPPDGIDIYDFTDTVTVGSVISAQDIQILPASPGTVFAESNQPFAICQNVLSPSTIYGGRISTKHILFNWDPVLAISLYFAQAGSPDLNVSQIHTTQVKNNRLFTTQFKASEPNKGYAGQLILTEFANTNNSDYQQGAAIFTPKSGACQAYVGWNDYVLLKAALALETEDETLDGGGIVANDDLGNFWFCQVMDVTYDPVQQIADLKLQKVRPYFPTAGEFDS